MSQAPSSVRPFDEIEIGDEIGPIHKTPTTEMVLAYARVCRITGLEFFFHEKGAQQAGLSRPIVPGPLNATYLCQMLEDHFAGWRLQTFNTTFRMPIRHGETVSLWGMVTDKHADDGQPTVFCDLVVENEHGERAITGTAVLVQPRPELAAG